MPLAGRWESTETSEVLRSCYGIRFGQEFFPDFFGFGCALTHLLKSALRIIHFLQHPLPQKRASGSYGARPWKNVSYDVGDGLCFSAVTGETPVD